MKIYLIIIIALLSCFSFAQSSEDAQKQFFTAYEAKDAVGMNKAADLFMKVASDNSYGYVFKSFAQLSQGNIKQAEKYAKIANAIYPGESNNYLLLSYVDFAQGESESAKKHLAYSYQLSDDSSGASSTHKELDMLTEMSGIDFSGMKAMATEVEKISPGSAQNYLDYSSCVNKWYAGEDCNVEKVLTKWNSFPYKNPLLPDYVTATRGIAFYYAGKFDKARIDLEKAIKSTFLNPYAKAMAFEKLATYDRSNANRGILLVNQGLEEAKKIGALTLTEADLLYRKALITNQLGQEPEALKIASELLTKAQQLGNDYHIINAQNIIGSYYVMQQAPGSTQKAMQHLGEAYKLAHQRNFEDQKMKAATNFAMVQFKVGNEAEAVRLNNMVYDYNIKKEDYFDAQNVANNLGFMFFYKKNFSKAAEQFRKAVDITEKHLSKYGLQEQLYARNQQSSAYSGLVMSLAKTRNAEQLFEIQDLNRSRVLRQQLDKKAKSVKLVQVQSSLKDDEAMIYYSMGAPGQMIASLVTKSSISVVENYPINEWLKTKKIFTNAIQQKPNSINGYMTKLNEEIVNGQIYQYTDPKSAFKAQDFDDFVLLSREVLELTGSENKELQNTILKQWYSFLIQPLEKYLAGKKTIIISPENQLNAMPFEAFMDAQGKYLLEKYNVKYVPSATVWYSLLSRDYDNNRKPLLAMGGATYADPKKNQGNIRGQADYIQVQVDLSSKIGKNQNNLSKELKALGFGGANYLKGTLVEVQNLKKIIPEADVLINQEMKESDIKSLNRDGRLDDYKYIHIATHGFANASIPELSGIMMTQPPSGDGNEDMFLLAHEIATLDLNADMAVLSACETALGKNYKGEGVNGLNSALLTAGANSTLLSLWPVDDAGTMTLMTEVYNNLYTNNMTVEDAVNSAKRKMLSGIYGERFTTPKIWAPFILSGR